MHIRKNGWGLIFITMNQNNPENKHNTLVDQYGRRVNYLRISVTDRCDLRCTYCMPEKMKFLPRAKLLTLEEIELVADSMIRQGVEKIRITGGEPLVRRNILKLFRQLGCKQGLKDLTLTTNGSQLSRFAQPLKDAGVTRINISLDSLQDERFRRITRTGRLSRTLQGIDQAVTCGFKKIKINSVVMKNHNDDEIHDLVRYAIDRQIDISFIEEMPVGSITEHDRAAAYYSSDQILQTLQQEYELLPSTLKTAGPARYYRMSGIDNTQIGFISPHSHNFCADCNRVRLTSEGRLLLCLGQEHSMDLRHIIRAYPGQSEKLDLAIKNSMNLKPKGHDFDQQMEHSVLLRHMNMTGG